MQGRWKRGRKEGREEEMERGRKEGRSEEERKEVKAPFPLRKKLHVPVSRHDEAMLPAPKASGGRHPAIGHMTGCTGRNRGRSQSHQNGKSQESGVGDSPSAVLRAGFTILATSPLRCSAYSGAAPDGLFLGARNSV